MSDQLNGATGLEVSPWGGLKVWMLKCRGNENTLIHIHPKTGLVILNILYTHHAMHVWSSIGRDSIYSFLAGVNRSYFAGKMAIKNDVYDAERSRAQLREFVDEQLECEDWKEVSIDIFWDGYASFMEEAISDSSVLAKHQATLSKSVYGPRSSCKNSRDVSKAIERATGCPSEVADHVVRETMRKLLYKDIRSIDLLSHASCAVTYYQTEVWPRFFPDPTDFSENLSTCYPPWFPRWWTEVFEPFQQWLKDNMKELEEEIGIRR